jgi:hypothetical protein
MYLAEPNKTPKKIYWFLWLFDGKPTKAWQIRLILVVR